MRPSLSTLRAADAISVGHTLRALAHTHAPNADAADVLSRVGEWLVCAGEVSKSSGPIPPLGMRASEVMISALQLAQHDASEAAASLLTALAQMCVAGPKPVAALDGVIDALVDVRTELAKELAPAHVVLREGSPGSGRFA